MYLATTSSVSLFMALVSVGITATLTTAEVSFSPEPFSTVPVSYTHLTLPTSDLV